MILLNFFIHVENFQYKPIKILKTEHSENQ